MAAAATAMRRTASHAAVKSASATVAGIYRNGGRIRRAVGIRSRELLRCCSCRRRRWRALSSWKRRGFILPQKRGLEMANAQRGESIENEVQIALNTVLKPKKRRGSALQSHEIPDQNKS